MHWPTCLQPADIPTCSVLEVVGSNSAAFPCDGREHGRFLTWAGEAQRTFIPQRCPEQVNPHPSLAGHLVPGELGRVVCPSLIGEDKNMATKVVISPWWPGQSYPGRFNSQTHKPLQQGNSEPHRLHSGASLAFGLGAKEDDYWLLALPESLSVTLAKSP